MGLDLIPKHDPCVELEKLKKLPGVTVSSDFRCPLSGASSDQRPMTSTPCWCRGKVAAAELEALGYADESSRMYEDMTDDQALEFGEHLLSIAAGLRQGYQGGDDKPRGAGWNGTWDGKEWKYGEYSSLEQAIEAIEDAGRWYKAVAAVGSGVDAWF